MYVNVTNMFYHKNIVYRDLGTAKIKKKSSTEKYLIINSMSDWI